MNACIKCNQILQPCDGGFFPCLDHPTAVMIVIPESDGLTADDRNTFADCVEDALMREHPVDQAQAVERKIDEDLPYQVRSPLTERRDAILAAFKEEPLTAGQANELIGELAEIETRLQEVIDPTGAGWFVFESIQEVQF